MTEISSSIPAVEIERKYQFDAIVVLGSSMEWNEKAGRWTFPTITEEEGLLAGKVRAVGAVESLAENIAPLIIVTGGVERKRGRWPESRAKMLREEMIRLGGDCDRIVAIGDEAKERGNTQGNMEDLAAYLKAHPAIQHIAFLTNPYHVARATEIVHQAFPDMTIHFLDLNHLLVTRSPHYQKWIVALENLPEMAERNAKEAAGLKALKEGAYKPTHK